MRGWSAEKGGVATRQEARWKLLIDASPVQSEQRSREGWDTSFGFLIWERDVTPISSPSEVAMVSIATGHAHLWNASTIHQEEKKG